MLSLIFIYTGDPVSEYSLENWSINLPRFPCSIEQGPEVLLDPSSIDGSELQARLEHMQQAGRHAYMSCSSSAYDSAADGDPTGLNHTPLASTRRRDEEITLNFSSSPVVATSQQSSQSFFPSSPTQTTMVAPCSKMAINALNLALQQYLPPALELVGNPSSGTSPTPAIGHLLPIPSSGVSNPPYIQQSTK